MLYNVLKMSSLAKHINASSMTFPYQYLLFIHALSFYDDVEDDDGFPFNRSSRRYIEKNNKTIECHQASREQKSNIRNGSLLSIAMLCSRLS